MQRTRPLLLLVANARRFAPTLDATFEIFDADDAAHATTLLPRLQPDAVLLDADADLCGKLRALPGGADVPIVFVTSDHDRALLEAGAAAGATDFVTAEVAASDLLAYRLRYLVRSASTLRETRASANRLARAQRLARLAQWELVFETGRFRWSEEVTSIFGIPPEAPEGGISALLKHVHTEDRMTVARTLLEGDAHRIEYRLTLPDGRVRTIHQEADVILDEDGEPLQLIGAAQDVTELREAEAQVQSLAYFDALTRLPNRSLLLNFLDRAIKEATERSAPIAILAIDLDGFKRVNDRLGHAAGDTLLREVATRLERAVYGAPQQHQQDDVTAYERQLVADSMISRLGGDEFVVALGGLGRVDDAAIVARRICAAIDASFTIGGTEVFISSSIGIACFPENGRSIEELLERADVAMYSAKERGRDNFQFYTPGLFEKVRHRLTMENALRAAMVRSGILPGGSYTSEHRPELFLAYQPKVEIPSGRMVGAEALLRWNSTELGFVSPADFIPIAEDTGLIVQLGEWVFREACLQSVRWADSELANVRIAVNVSARQFRENDFPSRIAAILEETQALPQRIELEITEGVVMQDTAGSSRILDDLKALGVRIALDDFGTGYSSLSYLAKLPIDALKIDRSFINSVHDMKKGATITSAIIALSRALAIDVVVEGVETAQQLDFVRRHGTAEIQGFLFAKPMPAEQLSSWQPPAIAQRDMDEDWDSGVFAVPVAVNQ